MKNVFRLGISALGLLLAVASGAQAASGGAAPPTDPRPRVVDLPALPERGAAMAPELQTAIAGSIRTMSLDRLTASRALAGIKPATVAVRNDPPRVIVSNSPAILVPIDGAPVLQPVAGHPEAASTGSGRSRG